MFMTAAAGFALPDPLYDNDQLFFAEPGPPSASFRIQRLGTYLVSDLFIAKQTIKSDFVHEQRLVTLCRGKELFFTGQRFSQWDLDVLLYCSLNTSPQGNDPGKFRFTPVELLHALNMRNSPANRSRVFESLQRLHTGVIDIRGRDYQYMTRLMNRVLVDTRKERCLVEVNGDVADCFRMGGIDRGIRARQSLSRNGLAKWIHGATMVFRGGFTAEMESLRHLCHVTAGQRHSFPNMLAKALELLESSGCIEHWHINGTSIQVTSRSIRERKTMCGVFHPGVCS